MVPKFKRTGVRPLGQGAWPLVVIIIVKQYGLFSAASKRPWQPFTTNTLVVVADDCLDFHGAQQPPRLGAAGRVNALSVLFFNLDAARASAKEIPERTFKSNRPWPSSEPSRWDGLRPPLSRTEVQVTATQFETNLQSSFQKHTGMHQINAGT